MVRGFTSVVGDLLHPGHQAMIRNCRKYCDYLIVGLICDPTDRPSKKAPIESVFERWYRLWSCKGVDEIVPLQGEKDLELALRMLDYDLRFVGKEYEGTNFTGRKICEERHIPIIFNDRSHGLSSSELRRRFGR